MEQIVQIHEAKVDSAKALEMWNAGKTLQQISAEISPGASRMAVSRAIRRAVRMGGTKLPPVSEQCGQRGRKPQIGQQLEQQILVLWQAGLPARAITKELGLGVGHDAIRSAVLRAVRRAGRESLCRAR